MVDMLGSNWQDFHLCRPMENVVQRRQIKYGWKQTSNLLKTEIHISLKSTIFIILKYFNQNLNVLLTITIVSSLKSLILQCDGNGLDKCPTLAGNRYIILT